VPSSRPGADAAAPRAARPVAADFSEVGVRGGALNPSPTRPPALPGRGLRARLGAAQRGARPAQPALPRAAHTPHSSSELPLHGPKPLQDAAPRSAPARAPHFAPTLREAPAS
jgi:hypothetical protein